MVNRLMINLSHERPISQGQILLSMRRGGADMALCGARQAVPGEESTLKCQGVKTFISTECRDAKSAKSKASRAKNVPSLQVGRHAECDLLVHVVPFTILSFAIPYEYTWRCFDLTINSFTARHLCRVVDLL